MKLATTTSPNFRGDLLHRCRSLLVAAVVAASLLPGADAAAYRASGAEFDVSPVRQRYRSILARDGGHRRRADDERRAGTSSCCAIRIRGSTSLSCRAASPGRRMPMGWSCWQRSTTSPLDFYRDRDR
jgi:hypothetical protein